MSTDLDPVIVEALEALVPFEPVEYSYGPRLTTGILSKLRYGMGDGIVHSSVFDCHGLASAFFPRNQLKRKLSAKIAWEANNRNALMEMNSLSGWSGFRKSYWVGS